MVRETRHLWVGNLPDNIREDRIREHFKRYGRVQSVKLLPRSVKEEATGEGATACTVAFMDIKSAAKAHVTEHKIDDRTLTTEYYEPAAIPSAASPQNTTSSYTTSPGTTRFPNGHGSTDDHGNFSERFYDRNTNRVSEGEYIRRSSGYHESNRGRNRDRGYRNGPYNNLMDRSHRINSNSSWTAYDTTTRYNNQNSDTGYSTAPSENSDRRTEQSTKKKTKSRSGSRSPSPSGSTSSRSPSRSRSRSSSSSSSSSTSRATSSTSSPKSRRTTTGNQYQSAVHSEDRRPLAICVRNLPCRSSDTSLKDGLFHEYKKHGKVTWVKVVGQSSERHAIVCFKKPEDVEKALEVSYDKLFFGSKIEVAPYQGHELDDNDSRLFEAEIDEFHPKATRTLFIGNLEKDVTASDLRKEFDQFGEIIEIDIKKQGVVSSYAFCQYSDIVSVVKAIRTLDGEHLGNNRIKLGFGKSMPTSCVWVDGISESVSEKYLKIQFEAFGTVQPVSIDREKGQALVFYDQVVNAQTAVNKMRGVSMKGRKIQVDFASRECQEAFYDHMDKQGHPTERIGSYEERRDSTTRTFETVNTTTRFSRYDTPTRPRTSSYSSRSSATASQCNASAIPSPGTPGSATPRGTGSRSRISRYTAEYYDQNSEYADQRHFRNYDEYSQGSAASHEETYEHEYVYHESPSHLETLERLQTNTDHAASFPQPDIRNLQKERVHLLEQLEEYPSSGDEVISPKKKLKLDHLDGAIISDVIIEANRDHRKVMEVRRLSDTTNVKHHSRRPSVDGKYRDLTHDRSSYLPHAVCKRRKTGGSDNGSRVHHYEHQSGSESVGGSRPGTPLCDERPEHIPTEPRRTPREREGPLSLPLPRFAAHVLHKGSISVAGIKGQKDNILSSPPATATSPRISNPKPPSPVHVPPPASPPPRPPSLSSTSSDSDIAPPSPSLDERIRSLDEKYEKWSGSRALSAAGGDALLKLDANREKFKFRHKLLDLDLKEVQPSEIVKSVMAKRSVFDEDTKRLENVGEKYEPKDFNSSPKAPVTIQTTVPAAPSVTTSTPILKVSTTQLPKTPTMLSPRSTSTGITPAKGLQYPFPTHPPSLLVVTTTTPITTTVITLSSTISTAVPSGTISTTNISSSTVNTTTITMTPMVSSPTQSITTVPTPSLTSPPSSSMSLSSPVSNVSTAPTAIRSNHGDNRLKPCVSGPPSTVNNNNSNNSTSDNRTSSKVSSVNRSVTNNNNNNTNNNSAVGSSCQKISDTKNIINNIPQPIATMDIANSAQDSGTVIVTKNSKSGRESKTSGTNDKISNKRDVNSGSDVRSRRNSETNSRKSENDSDKQNSDESNCDSAESLRRDERERLERERLEAEKIRMEKERLEKEERERQERERLEKERLEKQERLERERVEKERLEKERQERLKREREEKEKREKEERERKEREEREERERKEKKEREERERREREERERKEREREERERKEKEDREKREREEEKRERKEREEREERERREKEELERSEREKRKEEERKHKEDNHDKRKDDHSRHRDVHLDSRHTNHDLNKCDGKNAKEDKKEEVVPSKKDHDSRFHENRESKTRHHDRDSEKRKESVKENRENNSYDKIKCSEIRENKDRPSLETRHLSIDLEKIRQPEMISKTDPSRRKERNNSLPVNLGNKRRLSCHETPEGLDEAKKLKLNTDYKKIGERRNSKDVTNREEKVKNKHKSSTNPSKHDDKSGRTDKHNNTSHEDKRKERDEKHRNKQKDKQKSKSKNRDKESPSTPNTPGKEVSVDKDFLSRLESVEPDKQKRKESKEKKKQDSEGDERRSDDSKKSDESKSREKLPSIEKNKREELSKSSEERKSQKKDRIRKITNSSDNSDSDEPKKHSIFDIVDDEPAYISMYDKVKARSCKNMQKQEEEKRQEKIKAKFSQLKQSRAKREEKKRSTSWDEDSDSDRECKTRKGSKMLIRSSDEEDNCRKALRKKETYYDSDSERNQVHKQCSNIDSSDDDHIKNNSLQRKGSKSRIASDTSDDEFKIITKDELQSDNEDRQSIYDFGEDLFKKIKEETEDSKYIKKEKKITKHETLKIFGEASSADESMERKEKSEMRKKHKKKQKRQKNSISSEDSNKLDSLGESMPSEGYEKIKNADKKKQHNKKDKKRDKSKDESREKSKKSKKTKSESKRDGKMENIFGSLSDDSESCNKEQINSDHKHFHMVSANDDNIYASDSDGLPSSMNVSKETYKAEVKERNLKEEHRKRKEKRRREKEKQRKREELNENSIDFIDLGKQLEENIKDDSNEGVLDVKLEPNEIKVEQNEDTFMFSDFGDSTDVKKEERKENREKKKKRKKNKEEKQRHHHHHHHDKNKIKSPDYKKEVIRPPSPKPLSSTPTEIDIKVEVEKQSPSLPNILDIPSPPQTKSSPNLDISPVTREPMISPIPKTPTSSKEKKREKLIPGFGSEIDEKIHENAVKSISEFEQPKQEKKEILADEDIKDEKPETNDEKPRVVISQEETEDAVAALLGESFGSGQFDDCYNEQQLSPINNDQVANISDENVQDDEEMRQAVRSLNSTDLDIKPDTPQSEHDLQIDTDTEEQEDISVRYDQPPKTPDTVDLSQPPKTPDIPSYYRNEDQPQQQAQKTTIVIKTTGIGSPPSLTPIKQEPKNVHRTPLSASLPILPEQRSVISKSWVEDKKEEMPEITNDIVKKVEEPLPPLAIQAPQLSSIAKVPNSPRHFTSIPTLKVTEPTFTDSNKQPDKLLKLETPKVSTSISVLQSIKTSMHNVPPHIPYPIPTQKPPGDSGIMSPKLTSSINRLPITSVQVVSKPTQSTTLILPQPKQAHSSETLKLIAADRPRMIYQNTPNLQQFTTNFGPRMMQRCGLPPQGLLLPNKTSYTAMRLSVKGNNVIERPLSEPPKLVPTSSALPSQSLDDQHPQQNFAQIRGQQNFSHVNQPVQQTIQVTQTPFTPLPLPLPFQTSPSIIVSPHTNMDKPVTADTTAITTSTTDTKTFTPVIQEAPKLVAPASKPEARSPQPAIIQQAPPKASTPVQQSVVDVAPKSDNAEVLKTNSLKADIMATSTPSPVIIPNVPANIEKPPIIKDLPQDAQSVKVVDKPEPQLAIEKVTEELNLTLEKEGIQKVENPEEAKDTKVEETEVKETTVKTDETKNDEHVKDAPAQEIKTDNEKNDEPAKLECEGISVIKEIEKIDEEKADTDSVVSDISKERLSAEILSKDDPLDSKEDSDYWSAKEVNIESVIKTVDALCSADDLSDRSSEIGKDDWFEENKIQPAKTTEKPNTKSEVVEKKDTENDTTLVTNDSSFYEGIENIEEKEVVSRGTGRRGGRSRGGRKSRSVVRVGVQTRRAKVKESTAPKRGGRGGRPKNDRKSGKSDSETCADVYEFRDDTDDTKDRPRLILTIKQQAPNSANGNAQQTAIVKEVMKPSLPPTPPKIVETKEEFTSPVSNTRKSRRLQEKDVSRNTVDDTIEDVIKNTTIVTRSSTAMAQNQTGPRRSTRQSVAKSAPETPRKSPRGVAKKKDRRASETTDDSSEEKVAAKPDVVKNEPPPVQSTPPAKEEPPVEVKEVTKEAEVEEPKEKPKEKPHEGLKATVLRRVKGELTQEPMTLIDPVTGLLTPMRECEEGKYIPISGSQSVTHAVITTTSPPVISQASVVTSSFQKTPEPDPAATSPVVIKQTKPQSLKAHVLSSQAAKAVVSHQMPPQKPITSQNLPQTTFTPNSINQNLNINVSSVPSYVSPHLSPRPNQAKTVHGVKSAPSQVSPNQQITILQKAPQQPQQSQQNKVINPVIQSTVVNAQMTHMKQPPVMKQQAIIKQPTVLKQQQIPKHQTQPPLVLNKTGMMVKHAVHQQPVLGVNNRVVSTTMANKVGVDPPKVEVSMAGCVMVPRSNVSPQNQPRHVLQAGMPVPAYEASLHGERGVYNRSRSPPPAHQNSPSPQGEAMSAHFPPGSVPLRPPHDLSTTHYLHAPHVVYQQLLRQYIPRSPMVAMEKSGDGQEGEEAPVTSPPLELRRPGSVGLALSGRSNAVPHSLQSPHDRTTDSPQVYGMPSARVHYHPGTGGRYYEQEPPPAHRPVTSHGSLAALGSERALSHMGPLGTPDRPLSAHSAVSHLGSLGTPERSLSTHLPERPLSGHGIALGAGLGAAGNLIGAVARHVGADAPASQRGIQAATPPHASQVPPQAESLLMLLKQYPCMWQGLLALKNDQAAVQMYFVSGNDAVAKCSLPKNSDGSTPPLRIFQRMRLEPPQVEGVARKMQMENEHCMLLALPCGHDHMDVLKQSTNLNNGFITYLQQKQAAGIVNVAAPGTTQPPAYVVHIFPSCDFVNENLRRIAPSLLERVADIAHLLIVITTV